MSERRSRRRESRWSRSRWGECLCMGFVMDRKSMMGNTHTHTHAHTHTHTHTHAHTHTHTHIYTLTHTRTQTCANSNVYNYLNALCRKHRSLFTTLVPLKAIKKLTITVQVSKMY